MTEPPSTDALAAAQAYEDLHVPALFAQWAPRVLEAVGLSPGGGPTPRVLDVACGTGVLARTAAARLGGGATVTGVDPDAAMLAVAARVAPDVTWCEGTADTLPLDDASVDLVVSQFGLMFFPDRDAAVREMLRVLVPGGRLAIAVWDSLERSEAYDTEVAVLDRIAGRSAGDALRAPFVLGDPEALGRLVADAGASSVRVSTEVGRARFPSIRVMVEADLRGWLPVMGVQLDEPTMARILDEAETALAVHVTDTGTAEFDSPAHIVTGAKP